MANKITNTDYYSAIANAIRRKNGETDTYTPAEMVDAIGRIPKGGGGASEGDVTFYDYDGSIVASYTAAQFAALEEMPENPDHSDDGLTSQGWNWNLTDAKTYVAKYGKLNVGQMYVPTDGKTHVFINIPEDDPSYETTLYFGHTTASGQTVVDWGDGSPTETFSGTSAAEHSHTYSNPGKYEITLDTVSGVTAITGSSYNRNGTHFSGVGSYARNFFRIEKAHFSNKTRIGDNSLSYCHALQIVTIPEGVTIIGRYAFYYCYALQSIIIPEGVASINDNAFTGCYSLQSIPIPHSVTVIGGSVFSNCYLLHSVTIPDNVTNIGTYMCYYCYALQSLIIPEGVKRIGNNTCYYCYTLQSITIPESVTYIESSAFAYCYSLQSITIPEQVKTIWNNAFQNCYSLQSITISESVTSIGSNVFSNCYTAYSYHLASTTPPTLSNTNTFNGISTDTVFYVPAASLEAYKTANNWSTYASRMVAEPE